MASVAGSTSSEADFPPDGLTFDAAFVVCRLDATGSVLDFTHTVNSGSANRGNGVALDALGNVYFTGTVGVPASVYVSKLGMGPEPTGVEAGVARDPAPLALGAAHPNPFRPETRVEYVVPDGIGGYIERSATIGLGGSDDPDAPAERRLGGVADALAKEKKREGGQ